MVREGAEKEGSPRFFDWFRTIKNLYPHFSPDGRHVAWLRSVDPTKWKHGPTKLELAVDGIGIGWKGQVRGFEWNSSGRIHALVERGKQYVLATIEVEALVAASLPAGR